MVSIQKIVPSSMRLIKLFVSFYLAMCKLFDIQFQTAFHAYCAFYFRHFVSDDIRKNNKILINLNSFS